MLKFNLNYIIGYLIKWTNVDPFHVQKGFDQFLKYKFNHEITFLLELLQGGNEILWELR